MVLARPSICRSGLATMVTGTVTALLVQLVRQRPAHPSQGFDAALVLLASWALLAAVTWAFLVSLAVLVHATTGRSALLRTCCPQAWRGAALVLCGAALVSGAAAPTFAADGAGAPPTHRQASGATALPALDRPPGTARITVVPGDSLWRIAAREHPGMSVAEVAEAVRELYAGNHQVIGPDPDLLHPGQRLVPTHHERTHR